MRTQKSSSFTYMLLLAASFLTAYILILKIIPAMVIRMSDGGELVPAQLWMPYLLFAFVGGILTGFGPYQLWSWSPKLATYAIGFGFSVCAIICYIHATNLFKQDRYEIMWIFVLIGYAMPASALMLYNNPIVATMVRKL